MKKVEADLKHTKRGKKSAFLPSWKGEASAWCSSSPTSAASRSASSLSSHSPSHGIASPKPSNRQTTTWVSSTATDQKGETGGKESHLVGLHLVSFRREHGERGGRLRGRLGWGEVGAGSEGGWERGRGGGEAGFEGDKGGGEANDAMGEAERSS